jgi:hypothetical protein
MPVEIGVVIAEGAGQVFAGAHGARICARPASSKHRDDYEQSGLLAVSGITSDLRELLTSADPQAAEAVDLFVCRIGREMGAWPRPSTASTPSFSPAALARTPL